MLLVKHFARSPSRQSLDVSLRRQSLSNNQILNALLCLIAAISAGFPWLFLINYDPRFDDPADKERFKNLDNMEMAWILFVIGLSLFFAFSINQFNVFAIIALLFCLVSLPEALLAGLTGIYRKQRYRGGHFDYYEKHKDPRKQFFASSRYPMLQVIGWIQICLFAIVIPASILAL
jgi:hypothetical protein